MIVIIVGGYLLLIGNLISWVTMDLPSPMSYSMETLVGFVLHFVFPLHAFYITDREVRKGDDLSFFHIVFTSVYVAFGRWTLAVTSSFAPFRRSGREI